jgi:plastocyanin domain-containing protein
MKKGPVHATPWHSTNAFKIGIGLGGIFVLVILLVTLIGITQPVPQEDSASTAATTEGGAQVIRMAVTSYGYQPNTFTVKAGTPVKWVIDGTGVTGCTRYLVSTEFGINQKLTNSENVIEFTPTNPGSYSFHCGMNMVRGTMNVV